MSDVEKACDQCDEILRMINEDLSTRAWDKGGDFFESVKEGVEDMRDTIVEHDRVTENQQQALDNWQEGVGKWIHDD